MSLYHSYLHPNGEYESTTPKKEESFGAQYKYKLTQFPKLDGHETKIQLTADRNDMIVCVQSDNRSYFNYLTQMPNNCGMIILSGVNVYTPIEILDYLISLCSKMRYSQVMYTIADGQGDLAKTLVKLGFKLLEGSTTVNHRSGNDISTYILNVYENEKEEDNADY